MTKETTKTKYLVKQDTTGKQVWKKPIGNGLSQVAVDKIMAHKKNWDKKYPPYKIV